MFRKKLATLFLAGVFAVGGQFVQLPGTGQAVISAPRAEAASPLANLFQDLLREFTHILSDPALIQAFEYSVRSDFARSVILQREAYDEYISLAESKDCKTSFDRVAVYRDILNGTMPHNAFLAVSLDQNDFKQKLTGKEKIKDFMTPAMHNKIQSIADKRHAAQHYRSRARRNIGLMLLAIVGGAIDRSRTNTETLMNINSFSNAISSIKEYTGIAKEYEKPTKKFLDGFEKKLALDKKDKKQLMEKDWGFSENTPPPAPPEPVPPGPVPDPEDYDEEEEED